jgi:hypothetical protein
MKVYRKTATVKAKIFEPGDEDGFVHRDGTAGAGQDARAGVTKPNLVPYISTLENQYFTGEFGENYVCTGDEGERWLVKKSVFELTYEELPDGKDRFRPGPLVAAGIDPVTKDNLVSTKHEMPRGVRGEVGHVGVAGLHVCGQYVWDPRSTAEICLMCGSDKQYHTGIRLTPTPNVHVNQIKVEGDTPWAQQFNLCSDLYLKSMDRSLSAEQRKKYLDLWFEERQKLELGIYTA